MKKRILPSAWGFTALLCFALLPGCASVLSATRDDDRSTLARLLRNGASPDEASSQGTTPLFVAVEAGNLHAAKLLVEAGADVNNRSRCRDRLITPIQKAAIHGDVPMVRYLLRKGADPKIADEHDVFTLMAMMKDTRDTAAITAAIVESVSAAGEDGADQALLDARAPSGWTPLAAAVWFEDVALVDALIAHGASVELLAYAGHADEASDDDWPPLYFALLAGNQEIADRLLAAGADPEQTSRDGKTSAEIIAGIQQRAAERLERERQRELEAEEERRQTFAMFQQGMEALATGVQEGMEEARETRASQEEAQAYLYSARAESTDQEQEPATSDDSSRTDPSSNSSGVADGVTPTSDAPSQPEAPAPGSEESEVDPIAPEDSAKQEEARQQEAEARKREEARMKEEEEARRQEEARKKEEARKQEEEARKQEEAQKKEAAAREAREYREELRRAIRPRAQVCRWSMGKNPDYCGRAEWPSHVKDRGAVYVSLRATCDRIVWTSPVFFSGPFLGGSNDEVQFEPKLSCSINQVHVEVAEVR